MKRFSKLLYIVVIFSMLLMPYTTVYAEDAPGSTPDSPMTDSGDTKWGNIDPDDQNDVMLNLEIPYYNTEECEPGSSMDGSNGDTTLNGNDNEEKVFNYLKSHTFMGHKLNAAQIAGIMQNLRYESGFDPNKVNPDNDHKGIAQWSVYWKRWDDSMAGSLEKQLAHLDNDLNDSTNSSRYGSSLEAAGFFRLPDSEDGARQATESFCNFYENPGASKCAERANVVGSDMYRKYAGKVGQSGGMGVGRTIWFGDSRTLGMQQAMGKSGDKDIWIAERGADYDWFSSSMDGLGQLKKQSQPDDTIIINFGVNDPGNVDKYISKINELASNDFKNNKIVVMSVNPIDDTQAAKHKLPRRNHEVIEFNAKMKAGLKGRNVVFVDTYSQLQKNGFNSDDGVHYTAGTYKALHDIALSDIADGEATLDAKVNKSCTPNATGAGPTKYAKDGAKIYDQADPKWANKKFGGFTIQKGGCGPSAMAMIITALTNKDVTPDQVADYVASLGGVTKDGASWELPSIAAQNSDWGIRVNDIATSVAAFNSVLDTGGMVWACGSGGVPFSSEGHCIGIRARTDNGKWLIFDSGHTENSNKEWDPQVIINGIAGNGAGVSGRGVWKK